MGSRGALQGFRASKVRGTPLQRHILLKGSLGVLVKGSIRVPFEGIFRGSFLKGSRGAL